MLRVRTKDKTPASRSSYKRKKKMIRMRDNELAMANIILQSNGQQPFEVMQLQLISENEIMHEKLHKFQATEYQKYVTGSLKMDVTTTPCKDIQNILSTPRQTKRLKIQNTAEIKYPMWKNQHQKMQ